jgi:predicted dienelactone hydrolase
MFIRALAIAALLTVTPARAAQTLSLTLAAVEPGRDATVNVWLPDRAASVLPVIVFSHGNYCEADRYGVLFEAIADAGYAILAPAHLDRAPPPTDPSTRLSGAQTWPARLADMRAVADRLAEIEKRLPGGVKLDSARMIAAGHSYGGAVAQALGGATMYARDGSTAATDARDARFKVVLAWSPPGPIKDFIDASSAKTLAVPMLLVTGTKDFSSMWPEWRLHAVTYDGAPPGGKTLMVVEGLDHYLGGLACLPKETPPQADEAKTVAAAMIAFLDAQTKADAKSAAIMACKSPAPWAKTTLTCK